MRSLSSIVSNKHFGVALYSDLLCEWSATSSKVEVVVPPLPVLPDNGGSPNTSDSDDIYNYRPHIQSERKKGRVTVPVERVDGIIEERDIEFYYSEGTSGGEGGSGYSGTDAGGVVIPTSGNGGYSNGIYSQGAVGKNYIHSKIKKYQTTAPSMDVSTTDAYLIYKDPDVGVFTIVPEYSWGRGTRVNIKPGTEIYIYGGHGEVEIKNSKRNGFDLKFAGGSSGGSLGFVFDESVVELGITSVEVINGQHPLMSTTGNFNPRVYDDPSSDYFGNMELYCKGGRSCYMMLNSGNSTLYQVMLACAGGGGGACVSGNNYSKMVEELLTAYQPKETSTCNTDTANVTDSKSANVKLANIESSSFVGGSGGLNLSISINGDIDANKIRGTLNCELRVFIQVNLLNLKKYSKTITYNKILDSSEVFLMDIINLNTLYKEFNLTYADRIADIDVSVYSSIPLTVYGGCFGVSLLDSSTPDSVSDFTYGEPVISYNNESDIVVFEDGCFFRLIRGRRDVDFNLDDIICYEDDYSISSIKPPSEPNNDGLFLGESLDIKIRRG